MSEVYIIGLSKLEKLHIENNSFTARAFGYGNHNSKVFQELNCERLQSIWFGKCNYTYFAGTFKLKNLPSLEYLVIGF